MSDANYVLIKLDSKNAKALFRRAHAYKEQGRWEDAARDLQELYKENKTDDIKNDISLCLKKAIEAKKAKPATPAPPKSMVEEVKLKPGQAKSVKIEEGSSDSDDNAEAIKKLQ